MSARESTPLVLYGATGRMGSAIRSLLPGDPRISLRAAVAPAVARAALAEACDKIDASAFGFRTLEALPADTVVLDVSLAAGTAALLAALEREPRAVVFATTGLAPDVEKRIEGLALRVPVLRARNLSLGIAVTRRWLLAIPDAAREAFVADVVEHHHAGKKDAPSGTALELAAAMGAMGPARRPGGIVPAHAVRAGTLPGTHRVILSGDGETLELVHTVYDRTVFARGALRAVRFVHGRAPGLYDANDLVHDTETP